MKSLLLWMALVSAPAFAQTTWSVDPGHAAIFFKVSHMGFANVFGMIPISEGTITLNDSAPEKSSFEVKAAIDKINTFNPKRDDHLRGPDFFNVKLFPVLALKSKAIKKAGDIYEVSADLTMHGVTKPVNFKFNRSKTGKDPWGGTRTGGEASFKVKRSDFGVSYMSKPGEIGDEVELQISLEAVQK